MKIQKSANKLEILSDGCFNIQDILECGQVFRFTKNGQDDYDVFSKDKKAHVKQNGENIEIVSDNIDYFENYFDLAVDYPAICQFLERNFADDKQLVSALEHGKGIRILNQDPFEATISFILTSNNNIVRVQKIIESICKGAGEEIDGFFAFPTARALAKKDRDFFNECGCGYRSNYLEGAMKMLESGEYLAQISELSTEDARTKLTKLPGVGPKVADCILLFGFHRMDVFPIDTWTEKVYHDYYGGFLTDRVKIASNFVRRFDQYSGYVQQYLFYFKRTTDKSGVKEIVFEDEESKTLHESQNVARAGDGRAEQRTRPQGERTERAGGRPQGERTERSGARPQGERTERVGGRPQGERTERSGGRPQGERTERVGGRPQGERTERSGARPQGERTERSGTRPQGERTERAGGRPQGERTERSGGRPQGERTERAGGRPQDDRAERVGTRPQGERTERAGTRPQGERAERAGTRPQGERTERAGTRPQGERTERVGGRVQDARAERSGTGRVQDARAERSGTGRVQDARAERSGTGRAQDARAERGETHTQCEMSTDAQNGSGGQRVAESQNRNRNRRRPSRNRVNTENPAQGENSQSIQSQRIEKEIEPAQSKTETQSESSKPQNE